MNRNPLIVAFLVPLCALSQVQKVSNADPGSMLIGELCEQRSEPEALAELERRDVFSRRELRSIRQDRIRPGITEEALFCFMGRPRNILPLAYASSREVIEAYTYPAGDERFLIVQIRHGEDESTVQRFYESDEESLDITFWYRSNMPCRGGGWRRCRPLLESRIEEYEPEPC